MMVGNSTRQFEHFEGDFVYGGSIPRLLIMTRQADCNTFPAIVCRYGVARTETTSKIAPTIQTVFVPLKSIFIAAGSWRKLLLAPYSTCEPVSKKKVGRYTRKCTGEIERKCNVRCKGLDVRHEMMRE